MIVRSEGECWEWDLAVLADSFEFNFAFGRNVEINDFIFFLFGGEESNESSFIFFHG